MPDKKKIAVAILNWNGESLLRRFLPSVIEHSEELAKIYVIDNNSTDHSREILRNEFPTVELIELPANYGYAGGYNKGIAYIPEEYIVLLNSDVEVSPNWLEPLLERFKNMPELAALQPRIRDLNKPQYFEYAGAAGGYVDSLGYPFCRGRIFDELEKDEGQYSDFQEVFWASGACLMVDRSKFVECGELDESLFAHMEEIDLCWRMQLQGYKIGCEPSSIVYHLGGGTLNKLSPKKTYLNFRNSLIIMFLNLPSGEGMVKTLSRMMLDGVAGVRFLLQGKVGHLFAILKAHFHFYSRFNSLARKKINKPTKSLHSLQGVYKGSIVKDFYLGGNRKFSDLNI